MQYKNKIPTVLIAAVVILCTPCLAGADDNEIFGAPATIEPNTLFVIDNSGSMSSEMEVDMDEQECKDCEYAEWECLDQECVEYNWYGGCEEYECVEWGCVATRMDIAKNTVKNIIDKHGENNRFGIMVFHRDDRDERDENYQGGYIIEHDDDYATCSVKDNFILDENGEKKTGDDYEEAIEDYKEYLKAAVDKLYAEGSTPLAETLFEAGRYFAGEESLFNPEYDYYPEGGDYPDTETIGLRCRENYLVLMSDGKPQMDHSIKGETINGHELTVSNDYPTEGDDDDDLRYYYDEDDPELHDVAALMYENNINSNFDDDEFTRNVTTYTIGFSSDVGEKAQNLLQDTADRGSGAGDTPHESDGGLFIFAEEGQQELEDAFETIMADIEEKSTFFAAPAIPVSQLSKAYAGDSVYMAMFQPQSEASRWIGNLKKYKLNSDGEFASCTEDEDPILDPNDEIKDTAKSCWSSGPDGGEVKEGGAGDVLAATDDEDRNIYYNDDEGHNGLREFTAENTGLDQEVVDNIRMKGEDWKLGDFNHSEPETVHYESGDKKYIFAGSNDGMLHCFDDSDGSEKWAFVPEEQFDRLEEAYTGNHSYFLDGSPVAGITDDGRKILIFGERRGGNRYYALDITDIENPEFLYTRETDAQSWEKPQFVTIKTGQNSSEEAFLITGGYDTGYDEGGFDPDSDNPGNYVEFIDPEDGSEVQRFDSPEDHSIVNAFAADTVDDGNDIISQVYAGDLGGNMLAFRDNDDPGDRKALDGQWQEMHLFSALSAGSKIFEEADSTQEYIDYWDQDDEAWKTVVGDYVYFGTGDRANPLSTETVDHFYCVKNDWHTEQIDVTKTVDDFETLHSEGDEDESPSVMVDVTESLTTREKGEKIVVELEAEDKARLGKKYNRGWYIELEDGEKVLSSPTLDAGIVYFTTFKPDEDIEGVDDPCSQVSGVAGTVRQYALDYKTGEPAENVFDEEPDNLRETRYGKITTQAVSIAPSPQIIVTPEGVRVTEGLKTRETGKRSSSIFYWKKR